MVLMGGFFVVKGKISRKLFFQDQTSVVYLCSNNRLNDLIQISKIGVSEGFKSAIELLGLKLSTRHESSFLEFPTE
jgi:hypothetical protein